MNTRPASHLAPYVAEIEEKIGRTGVDSLSERELMLLMAGSVVGFMASAREPFWRHWNLKEIAQAGIALLVALGVISAASATAASMVIGGAVGG